MSAPRTYSGGRPAWTALLAALVLLVQGLWPAAAMPRAAADGGFAVQMCTPNGLQEAVDHSGAPASDQEHPGCCDLCVMATAAATPEAGLSVPVRYAEPGEGFVLATDAPSGRARDPPRPPSQGPPAKV